MNRLAASRRRPSVFGIDFLCLGCLLLSLAFVACTEVPADSAGSEAALPVAAPPGPAWAIAIHGGAGVIERDLPEAEKQAYVTALTSALTLGRDALDRGERSVDVVEKVVRFLEDAPQFNAGKGAVFTHQGKHELDAAIMDGETLEAGAVTGVSTVKNPISLARLVLEKSPHVLLAGAGAEAFADDMGVERVGDQYFFVKRRYDAWQRALAREKAEGEQRLGLDSGDKSTDESDDKHGTVGAVALDRDGHLAAATSTGGLTNKRWGRVGDVPIVGAGTYANDAACAVSGTGIGEKFIRHTVAVDIAALVGYGHLPLAEAARVVIEEKLEPGDGGVITVDRTGAIAMVFNTPGMFRGAADADGRFEVAIWNDP